MKLLGSTKSKIANNENGKNIPNLEITEVVLVHCNIVNNNYQQNLETTEVVLVHCNIVNSNYQQSSRVLNTFVPSKAFGQLLDIFPKHFIFLKTFDSEFPYTEVWLTDQNSNLLETEDKINIMLNINQSRKCKK